LRVGEAGRRRDFRLLADRGIGRGRIRLIFHNKRPSKLTANSCRLRRDGDHEHQLQGQIRRVRKQSQSLH
jgi:hypothetical protein